MSNKPSSEPVNECIALVEWAKALPIEEREAGRLSIREVVNLIGLVRESLIQQGFTYALPNATHIERAIAKKVVPLVGVAAVEMVGIAMLSACRADLEEKKK